MPHLREYETTNILQPNLLARSALCISGQFQKIPRARRFLDPGAGGVI